MSTSNPFRAELPDGSRIERSYSVKDGKKVPRGNWMWVVYDPDRLPARKRTNLRVRDKGAALAKASKFAGRYAVGGLDPWADTAGTGPSLFGATAERYLAEKAKRASKATVEWDKGNFDRFERTLPAATDVRHVEPRHVETFVNANKRPKKDGTGGGPPSAETKKRRRASLVHFFQWGIDAGLCTANPAIGVSLPPMGQQRRDHITDEEAAAILGAVAAAEVAASAHRPGEGKVSTFSGADRAWVRDWVLFGLGTGLRPGEQAQLTWDAVQIAERTVEIGKGHDVKTSGSRRTVPVEGVALDVLRRLDSARGGEAGELVFAGAGGGPVAVDYLTRCLKRFAKEAGVRKRVTAYSLRHAYGTKMAGAGVPLLDLAKMMGTGLRMIERHYAHYDPSRGSSHVLRVFGVAPAYAPVS